jgi:uncharacterized protein YbjT (DUF2867 family)
MAVITALKIKKTYNYTDTSVMSANFKLKKAILIGASGFIGSNLLQELLHHADYENITVVVRKKLQLQHPKLIQLIGDFHSLPKLADQLIADEIFIALGTTKKKTPDPKIYYQIDHDYPVLAAKIAKDNGAKSVFVVTAVGANPDSGIFYVKTKGETERDIIALDFECTHIFRPSMILGKRQEHRPMEAFLIKIWGFVNLLLIGKRLEKYKGMDGKDIAKAMVYAAKHPSGKISLYHWPEMKDLIRTFR